MSAARRSSRAPAPASTTCCLGGWPRAAGPGSRKLLPWGCPADGAGAGWGLCSPESLLGLLSHPPSSQRTHVLLPTSLPASGTAWHRDDAPGCSRTEGREGGSVGGPTNLVISLCTEPLWRSCHRGIKCRLLTPSTKSQGPGIPPPSPPPQPLLSRLRPSGSRQPSALCPSPPGFAHLAGLEPSSFPPWLTSPPRLSQAPHAPGCPICPTGVRGSPALSASGSRALGPRGPFSGTGPKFRIYLCGGKTCILFPPLEIGHHLFRLVFSCSSSD